MAAAFIVAVLARAQTCTTNFFVQSTVVRPDMLTEWLDLQKNDVTPAYKKTGMTSHKVLQTAFGTWLSLLRRSNPTPGSTGRRRVKALGAEGAARLHAKLRKCSVSVSALPASTWSTEWTS
jgi:hypothetical protein